MNLTNQELNNDDRNAEAAELVRDLQISSGSSHQHPRRLPMEVPDVLMVMIEVLTATVKV